MKSRNIKFGIVGIAITFLVLFIFKALNWITAIIAIVYWLGPTLFSDDFNE